MSYLLDTNVVSEWVKPRPDPRVVRWFAQVDEDRVHLSVVTIMEIRQGIEELGPGSRRAALESWLQNELPVRFEGRIIPITASVANQCGILLASSRKLGINLNVVDALFASTAAAHELALVTRNTRHFHNLSIPLFNPWADAAGETDEN